MRKDTELDFPFDKAGVYEIHVVGQIDESWSQRMEGMTISVLEQGEEDKDQMTVLSGWLPDQAALNGILNTLYDKQYALRYVALIDADK